MLVSGARRKVRASVLVAEGDDGIRALFVEYLVHAGFDAVGTAVALEALAAVSTSSTAAVVLDVELPGLDIADVARASALGAGALVLTCRTFEHLQRPIAVAEHVLKPCLPSTIVAAVMRALLRLRRAHAQ
jgi:DNA-binding response OmpR family regulator